MAVATRYSDGRLGRALVHVGRFMGVWLLLATTWAIGNISFGLLVGGPFFPTFPWFWLYISPFGAWLPALLVTVAWDGYEKAGGDD